MLKQNNFPLAMNDLGVPEEMSPIRDIADTESRDPIIEVNQPLKSNDLLEIRDHSSVTVI